MKNSFHCRAAVAQYVADQLQYLSRDSQLTMTMKPLKFGAFSVHTATDIESAGIAEVICPYCSLLFPISAANTPDG